MSDTKAVKWLAAGAALVAAPVAGMRLYHHYAGPNGNPAQPSNRGPLRLAQVPDVQPIDPSLIHYDEVGRIDPHVSKATALAITPSRNLIVAGEGGLQIVPPDGGAAHQIAIEGDVTCVAADDEGHVFVGLKDHVEVFALEGPRKSSWPVLGSGAYLTGIAVGADQVYLADSGRRVVVRTDRTGKPLNEIGRADPARGIPGLVLPSPHLGVAIAKDGTIWLNNAGLHRMENYTADGTLERFWGRFGTDIESFAGCCNPTDFWLLSDGSFVTTEKGVARVKHYLPDGRFDSVVAAPASFAPNMTGLAVVADARGRIFVLERGTGLIHVFTHKSGGVP